MTVALATEPPLNAATPCAVILPASSGAENVTGTLVCYPVPLLLEFIVAPVTEVPVNDDVATAT